MKLPSWSVARLQGKFQTPLSALVEIPMAETKSST